MLTISGVYSGHWMLGPFCSALNRQWSLFTHCWGGAGQLLNSCLGTHNRQHSGTPSPFRRAEHNDPDSSRTCTTRASSSAPQAQHSSMWQLRFWEPPGPRCLEQPFFLSSLFFGQKTKWSSWFPWPRNVSRGEQKVWAGDHRHRVNFSLSICQLCDPFWPQCSSSVKWEQLGFCFIVLLWGLNEIMLHIKGIANPH